MDHTKTRAARFHKRRLCALLLATLLGSGVLLCRAFTVREDIAHSVLRLHVLAHSDSEADQALKRRVRDCVLARAGELFRTAATRSEAYRAAQEHLEELRLVAQEEVRRSGFAYAVRIELGKSAFPTKSYGALILPAGQYDAVRIVIGSGRGQNWWCVMFPPLCFTNGTASLPAESERQLRAALTESEYALIQRGANEALPVKLRFKLLELAGQLFCRN